MRFSTTSWLLAATTLITEPVSAQPTISLESIVKRAGRTVTTGVQGSSGIQPRLEVRQLQQTQPDQWNLLLLAMQRWMAQDPTDGTGNGYYGIAGIHGVPSISWGGVEENSASTGANGDTSAYGYCAHKALVFPGWHRAYLALYEQMLVENAIAVAQEYPESSRARMVDAANKLRIPFWDWAAKSPSDGKDMPPAMTQASIQVDGPNGQQTIDNPLFQFNIADPGQANPYGPLLNSWHDTLRYPNAENLDAKSQNDIAESFLSNAQSGLRDDVVNLISNCADFQSFSNSGGASSQCAMSLEAIHDKIHQMTGGVPLDSGETGGHMGYLPLAAFDPAFWLHHANVDRIFALWQAYNPTQYINSTLSQPIGYPTWTYGPNELQNHTSPLTPFFNESSGSFHTLDTVKDWTVFNYQYPEFLFTDGSPEAIGQVVQAYYGPNASLTAGGIPVPTSPASSNSSQTTSPKSNSTVTSSAIGRNSTYSATGLPSHTTASSGLSFPTLSIPGGGLNPTKLIPTGLLPTGIIPTGISSLPTSIPELLNCTKDAGTTQNQYVANIVANPNALGGTYVVYVFNGAPQCSPQSYGLAKNLINSVTVFGHGDKTYGAVPLTSTLQRMVNAGKISNMSPNTVLPWLHQNLEWRIVGPNGEVSPDQVKGFSLSIYSAESEIQNNGGLPKWSPVQPQLGATKGKKGGADKVPDFVAHIGSGLLGQSGWKGASAVTTTMVVTQTHTICPCKTAASY